MDLTPPKCKRNSRSRHFVLVFTIENQQFPLKLSLGHPWDPRAPASSQIPFRAYPDCFQISQIAPCIYPDFERYPPKWFLAITCAIWLRLIFRGRGSAWFFGAHLLFFHARGRILEPRIGFWISRSTFRPGDLFGPQKWSRKKMCCGGMILWWGFRGIHPAQMNSMVPRSHMGRLLCPTKTFKK